MTNAPRPFDFDAAWQRIQSQYAARASTAAAIRPRNKSAILSALAIANITTVIVRFDGSGDSGQIEEVAAYSDDNAANLPEVDITIALPHEDGSGIDEVTQSLSDAIEQFAYHLLEATHLGWEDNEGAYGEFKFDVGADEIHLDYNVRIETSEYSGHIW